MGSIAAALKMHPPKLAKPPHLKLPGAPKLGAMSAPPVVAKQEKIPFSTPPAGSGLPQRMSGGLAAKPPIATPLNTSLPKMPPRLP